MHPDAGNVLALWPDAFALDEPVWAAKTNKAEDPAVGPFISVDLRRIIGALRSPHAKAMVRNDLVAEFTSLEASFG